MSEYEGNAPASRKRLRGGEFSDISEALAAEQGGSSPPLLIVGGEPPQKVTKGDSMLTSIAAIITITSSNKTQCRSARAVNGLYLTYAVLAVEIILVLVLYETFRK